MKQTLLFELERERTDRLCASSVQLWFQSIDIPEGHCYEHMTKILEAYCLITSSIRYLSQRSFVCIRRAIVLFIQRYTDVYLTLL